MLRKIISLRVYLFILLLCTVTPIIIFAAWLVLNFAKGQREGIEAGLRDTNRALTTALDREFQSSIAALNVLASSRLLDSEKFVEFYALCERARATQQGWKSIILHDPSGKTLLNLLAPLGKPLPSIVGKESFEKVLQTKKAAILELVKAPKGGWSFGVRVPVLRGGQVRYVLSAIIEPSHIGAIMREQKLPSSWLGIIQDQKHHLVAHTRSAEKFIEEKAAMVRDAPGDAVEGSLRRVSPEGAHSYSFFRRSPFSGWYVVLNVPAELLDGPVKRSLVPVIAVGLIALLFGSLFAISMSRRINESVAAIRTLAQALGLKQETVQVEKSPVSELNTITEALYDASKLLQESEAKQRKAEEDLRDTNNQLEHRVSERTAKLKEEMRERQALEESLRSQALLLQLTHDAIIVRSFNDARIQFWNKAATDVYGWSADEAVGKVLHELLGSRFPEPLKQIETQLTRTGRWQGEVIHTRKDGTELILEGRWSLKRDAEGRPLEILEVNSDITSRKYAEQKAQENEWLAGVGTMTAIFAHEIGNPLHSISTSLELVERQLNGKLKPNSRLKKTLELSTQEIQRVTALLREFRSFAKPQIANLKPTSLVDLIKDVLVPQIAVCRKSGITIKREFGELRPILMDDDKMKQVILNLCKNAIEAMPDGGVLTIRTRQSEDIAVLEISDTGVGIPQGVDVFQLFKTTKASGTGLGLAVVRQIIAAHQGSIQYTSEAGQGTTFRICLRAGLTSEASDDSCQQGPQNKSMAELETQPLTCKN
jgi:PAS domain S-box-containing protein